MEKRESRRLMDGVTPGPRLEVRYVAPEELSEDAGNARTHDERNLAAIGGSLTEFGQVEPLIVERGTGRVIGGNGRLRRLREMGATEVAVVEVDVHGPRAAALSLALNRTGELAGWDDEALLAQLRALQSEPGEGLEGTGFDDAEADRLAERIAAALVESRPVEGEEVDDPDGEWRGMPEFEHEDKTADAAFTIRVFLKDEDDLAEFSRLLGKDLAGRKFVWFSKQPQGTTYEAFDGPAP